MTAANGSTAMPTHRKLTELYAAAATHLALLAASYPGGGGIHNELSPDVESPHPPQRVCMSIYPHGGPSCDLGSSAGSQ